MALQVFKAVRTGLEPATSGVTGRHSNQAELPDLNYWWLWIFFKRTHINKMRGKIR
jgi:hypothetical protein